MENRLATSTRQVRQQDSDLGDSPGPHPGDVDRQMLDESRGLELVCPRIAACRHDCEERDVGGGVPTVRLHSNDPLKGREPHNEIAFFSPPSQPPRVPVQSWGPLMASQSLGSASRNWSSTILRAPSGIGDGFANRPVRFLRSTSGAGTCAARALTNARRSVVKSAPHSPERPSTRSALTSRAWTLRSAGCCSVTSGSLGRAGPDTGHDRSPTASSSSDQRPSSTPDAASQA